MKRRNMVLAFGMVAFCMAVSLFAADDPFNGTWKLNVAKSKFVPGPEPQSLTITVKVEGDTHNVKVEGKTSDGTAIETSFVAKLDGTPAPITGSPTADMISVRKINDRTLESKSTKGGSPVAQSRVTVSKDGKVVTITGSGAVNAKGVKTKNTEVYEKQ
jgi:hypothetical protein